MEKYDIIKSNDEGRKYTIRYKQYLYGKINGINNFQIDKHGCGPTTMATILSSLGYNLSPIDIAKYLLLDENNNQIDFFNDLENNRFGTRDIGYIYLLQKLINNKICNINYELIKLSYEKPMLKKELITEMIKSDYMAMICVGPHNNNYPKTFSNGGHYIALTSVNNQNNEFYIANPNHIGDNQIDITFPYELIVSNMYTNSFDFLMIKKLTK